jgi:hypothetical protein
MFLAQQICCCSDRPESARRFGNFAKKLAGNCNSSRHKALKNDFRQNAAAFVLFIASRYIQFTN